LWSFSVYSTNSSAVAEKPRDALHYSKMLLAYKATKSYQHHATILRMYISPLQIS